jgi:hypothetical protein
MSRGSILERVRSTAADRVTDRTRTVSLEGFGSRCSSLVIVVPLLYVAPYKCLKSVDGD